MSNYTGAALQAEVKNAAKSFSKAQEYTKGSFFSFRSGPDWDQVARHARDAVTILRRCGDEHRKSLIEALKLSAQANNEINSFNQSASDLEELAALYAAAPATFFSSPAAQADLVKKTALESSNMFRTNDQPDRAATGLVKASELLSKSAPATARELLNAACCVFEDADRAATAEATFKKALGLLLREHKDYEAALDLVRRQNVLYAKRLDMFKDDLQRNALAEVVLLLSLRKHADASIALDAAVAASTGPFAQADVGGSQAYLAGRALLEAVKENKDAMEKVRKQHSVFGFLDNAVSNLVFKMTPFTPEELGEVKAPAVVESNLDEAADALV